MIATVKESLFDDTAAQTDVTVIKYSLLTRSHGSNSLRIFNKIHIFIIWFDGNRIILLTISEFGVAADWEINILQPVYT